MIRFKSIKSRGLSYDPKERNKVFDLRIDDNAIPCILWKTMNEQLLQLLAEKMPKFHADTLLARISLMRELRENGVMGLTQVRDYLDLASNQSAASHFFALEGVGLVEHFKRKRRLTPAGEEFLEQLNDNG